MADSTAGPMGGFSTMLGGIVGSSQTLPTYDLENLYQTIQGSGAYQQQIIDQLPEQIKQQLAQYQASMSANTTAYQKNVTDQGAAFASGMNNIYGPNTDAANAEKNADKASIYSTVPGTQDAIRNAMAATGGLARGNAGVALAQPYIQAAQQNGQAAMGVDAKQTAAAQGATQTALQTVNSMEANMFQQTYGMTQQQAQQILTTGNDALKTQLANLITQNTRQTQQELSVEGIQDQTGYDNAVVRNEQQAAILNGFGNMAATAFAAS